MEEMMNGQNVMIWANLKQKKLGGVPSHGMVMCANAHDMDPPQCEIVRPPTDAKVGERIQLEGNPILNAPLSEERAAELNPKKKLEPKFMALLKTNDDGHVCYNGVRLMTSAGPLTVATLKNAPVS
jgi:tRNA-binding EMAP/Myf-like protein